MSNGLSGSLKFVEMTPEGLRFRAVLKSAAPAFAELLVERKGAGQNAKPAIAVTELAKNAKGESAKKKGNGSVQVLLKGDPKREHLAVVWEIDIVTASGGTGDLIFSARLGNDKFTEIARSPVSLGGSQFNAKAPANASLPVRVGTELSLIASYDMPWDGNLKAEIKAAQDKRWHPGSVSFETVANTPNVGSKKRTEVVTVDSVMSMLGAILDSDAKGDTRRKDDSITRVNIFAHGNPGLIGLSGRLDGDTIMMNPHDSDEKGRPIGALAFDAMVWLNEDDEGRLIRDTVRRKFTAGAEILLFLCNGGLGRGVTLAMDLSQCFNVRVLGYAEPIGYYVEFPGGRSANHNLTSIDLVPDTQFDSAKASGRINAGYPVVVQTPAGTSRGEHVQPDRAFPKPKTPKK
jgi:hypothetical protein